MSRDLTAAVQSAVISDTVRPCRLFYADFESGPIYLHDGVGTLTWDGNNYSGVGHYGGISQVEEDSEQSASAVSFYLTGIDSSLISTALGEHYQGRDIVSYIAFLNPDGQIILDPVIEFKGRMDNMDIRLGKTATIELRAADERADWDRPRIGRWNNADQHARFPDDKGFEFAEETNNKEIRWGGP
jgi:hypothetical protein